MRVFINPQVASRRFGSLPRRSSRSGGRAITGTRSTRSAASAGWTTMWYSGSRTTATRSDTCWGPWDWARLWSRSGRIGKDQACSQKSPFACTIILPKSVPLCAMVVSTHIAGCWAEFTEQKQKMLLIRWTSWFKSMAMRVPSGSEPGVGHSSLMSFGNF